MRIRRTVGRLLAVPLLVVAMAGPAGADPAGLRVEGGIDATAADWPFVAAVLGHGERDPFAALVCGGSVVAPTVVVTAAHCVTTERGGVVPAPALEVLVGTVVLRPRTGQHVRVAEVHVHPAWSWRRGTGDAAVLVLARPVTVAPVRLAGAEDTGADRAGASVRLAGWGGKLDEFYFTRELQELRYRVRGQGYCTRTLRESGRRYHGRVQLCAEDLNDERGACVGDSGGPLVGADADRRPVLVGIVSFGPANCGAAADYYTRVRGVASWLAPQLGRVPPAAVVPPTPVVRVVGTARVGGRLRCVVPGARPAVAHYLFRWLRDGAPIRGATARQYVVGERDAGRTLRCRVTASATGGDATRVSGPVAVPRVAGATRPA